MAEVYFIGDPHFGHKRILEFRPQFKSVKEHDDTIINNINKVVRKDDKLFILGDAVFDMASVSLLNRIKCNNIHLLLGNHDDYRIDFKALCPKIRWISGDMKWHEFWLSHIPLHPECLRGKYNIHAHLHGGKLKGREYVGVSLEQTGFMPVSVTNIRKLIAGKPVKEKKRVWSKFFRRGTL